MGRNCCITIERQYGSGGREVARILSERLGIPCYGRELLAVTAKDNGISIEELSAGWPGRDHVSLSEDALILPWTENATYLNCLSTLHPWRSANAVYARWMT